jgi:thymidine kinase
MERTGFLSVTFGPMASSKTSTATKVARTSSKVHGCIVAYITHKKDLKRKVEGGVEGKFTTHDSLSHDFPSGVDTLSTTHLSDLDLDKYDVIVIDEAQFYPDAYKEIDRLLKECSKTIYVYGLDTDFTGAPFNDMPMLMAIADEKIQVKAECVECIKNGALKGSGQFLANAPFTRRNNASDHKIIRVGGLDDYSPVCRLHHPYLTNQK